MELVPRHGAPHTDDEGPMSATNFPDEPGRDAEQASLPFTARDEDPIPFSLTARARRTVAPESLPELEVLPDAPAPETDDGADEPDPSDTRPARARALRRAGLPVERIARELRVDEVLARAWCGDVRARRRGRGTRAQEAAAVRAATTAQEPAAPHRLSEAWAEFTEARARACDDRRKELDGAPAFARGLGLVAALAELTPHAAVVTVRDPRVAAGVVRWLRDAAQVDERRLRVVLQVGDGLALDTEVHRWARILALPTAAIQGTRWRLAPEAEAVQVLVRVADRDAAARIAGWRDALLDALGAPEAAS